MKAYTDIEQSKRLAEILPIESADMHYSKDFDGSWFVDLAEYTSVKIPKYVGDIEKHLLPCWSLAALLDVLPDEVGDNHYLALDKEGKEYCCCYEDINGNSFKHTFANNPIDACYETIIKLHEQKLL